MEQITNRLTQSVGYLVLNKKGFLNRMSILQKLSTNNIKKAVRYCKKNGITQTIYTIAERLQKSQLDAYKKKEVAETELERQRAYQWKKNIKISLLVPAFETNPEYLTQMIESVSIQTYANWELVIVDASTSTKVKEVVKQFHDKRIVYQHLSENAGISINSNKALEFATGDYIGLLDHDDIITPDTLYEVAICLEAENPPILVYTDEDKVNEDLTQYFEPHYKKEFNLDLILSNNYICHFSVIEANHIRELKFRKEYEGAQDYDLFLRLVAKLLQTGVRIKHIDKILYHWRCHSGSTSENPESKKYAYEAGRKAVQDFVNRQGWVAEVTHTSHLGFYRIEYQTKNAGWKRKEDAACIFDNREDIGVVGGTVIRKGRIAAGAMQTDGVGLYDMIPMQFSGYMHRASLQQDVEAVDIRNMQVRRELQAMYKAAKEQLDKQNRDHTGKHGSRIQEEQAIRRISLSFCKKVREQGYLILFDPQIIKIL